jgi:hypothetical protein
MSRILLTLLGIVLTCRLIGDDGKNIAPPVEKQKGLGLYWKRARNVAAQAKFATDSIVVPAGAKKSLKITMSSPQGYAEWRITPAGLEPGVYTFGVWVKNRTEKKPYFMAYSFDANNKPRGIGGQFGRSGSNDWYLLSNKIVIPANSKSIRIGIGLSGNPGEVWFARPMLVKGKQKLEAPEKAPAKKAMAHSVLNKWVAEWVWVDDPKCAIPNVVFTKTVELPEQPVGANFQVTADNLYELSINGKVIGDDANWQTVETYDVGSILQKGKNVIKFSVMNFGGPGGGIIQGQVWFKDAKPVIIKTDSSWQYSIKGAKELPSMRVIGAPPVLPWGKIPLQRLSPPQNITLPVEKYSGRVKAGNVFRIVFKLTEQIPEDELANLKFVFFKNGKPAVISGYKTIITKYWNKTSLAVELPVSRYAMPGTYSWALKGITLNITPQSGNRNIEILPAKLHPFKVAKYPHRPTNVMAIPGGKQAPFVYATFRPSVENYINWLATDGHLYEIKVPTGYWMGPEKWNLQNVETNFMQILEADPYASVYLRVRVDTPSWWIRQYPDECYLSQKGRRGPQSFASDVWRKTVSKSVNALVTELEKRPVGHHLAGIIIMGFKGGEFQLWGESQGEYDCSIAAKKTFALWQKKNAISTEIKLPHPALESPFKAGPGYAAVRKNFFRFVAERHAGNFIYFADQFRKRFGKKYQFGLYFGYPMEHAGHRRMLFAGHLGVAKVLANAKLDYISCPTSYGLRRMYQSHAYMLPVTSALMHNTMVINENDIRNYKTPYAGDSSGATLPDLFTSLNSQNKLSILAAAHGTAVRYLALAEQVDFFQDSPILVEIRRMNKKIMNLTPAKIGQEGQIAMVLNYMEYCGAAEEPYLKLSRDFLGNIRDTLMRTGRPVAFVTMEDWLTNRKLWKYVVFPLPGLLTNEQKKVISAEFGKLPAVNAQDGAIVVTPEGVSKSSDLRQIRNKLSTPDAVKAGYDVIWYVGGNFKATYDTKAEKLEIKE